MIPTRIPKEVLVQDWAPWVASGSKGDRVHKEDHS
jgi:hypothetical protein